jgi:chloramphenicol 3-O phosphotransferase
MTIIFLNGAGSSGKSSIAKAIQHLADKPYIILSFDTFFNMLPRNYIVGGLYAKEGFNFIPYESEGKPAIKVESGEIGKRLATTIPKVAKIMADRGFNLIIDEILFGDELLKSYIELLKEHKMYFIAVKCTLESMEEREILRGDRAIGLSRDQINKVHKGFRPYDLEVDTTHSSSFSCAKKILDFINKT